ncbi:MAG: hypothetical protein HWN68_21045 [Desulfobacterales bacterium]|nr:hypothetical protein [Desulfobacterales bacterium]
MAIKTADDSKNHMRREYEVPNYGLIRVAVDSATVICIGDLLWLDTDDAKPASDLTWNVDEATTQGDFAAAFLGVAMSASPDGKSEDIVVATKGVFRFDINAAPGADLQIGTLVAPAQNATPDALLNQILKNAACADGIGKLVELCETTDTTMLVEIRGAHVPVPAS